MGDKKHFVFSARTTEEGLGVLNKVKAERKLSWDDLIIDAVNAHYGVEVPKVFKVSQTPEAIAATEARQKAKDEKAKEKARKEAERAAKKAEKEAAKKKGKKGGKKQGKGKKGGKKGNEKGQKPGGGAEGVPAAKAFGDPAFEPEEVLAERLARAEVVA